MSMRGPLARLVTGVLGLAVGVLAVAGGLELHGPGLVAVGVAGTLVGCLALGIARETPMANKRAAMDGAVHIAGSTVGALLVLSGIALVFGGLAATFAGVLLLGTMVLYSMVRLARTGRTARPAAGARAAEPVADSVAWLAPVAEADGRVHDLTTRELGREWVRTGGLLAAALRPADRVAVVRRRQETLDELELRDPAGFARWLAAGAHAASDPADYVHGDWTAGTDAA